MRQRVKLRTRWGGTSLSVNMAGSGVVTSEVVPEPGWNLPSTINVAQDGTVPVRQYAANASDWTISVSNLPSGVVYDAPSETLIAGAEAPLETSEAVFTLSKSGETNIVDTATVAVVLLGSHDFTGYPLDANGWTDLEAMVAGAEYDSAQVVYVSLEDGNDATASPLNVRDGVIGGNPFQPAGAVPAYRTVEAAKAALRDGFPDLMLFKSGETWTEERLGTIPVSGPNTMAPVVISVYGGWGQTSFVLGEGENGINFFSDVENIVVAHFRCISPEELLSAGRGFDVAAGNSKNILIEGCAFSRNDSNRLSGVGERPDYAEKIMLRRCLVDDVRGDNNIYLVRINGLLIEENVFHAPITKERWLYMSPSDVGRPSSDSASLQNVQVRGNTFFESRASGVGLSARGGGLFENNLFMRAEVLHIGGAGGSGGSVQSFQWINNVILESQSGLTTNHLQWHNIDGALIKGNIWAHGRFINGSSHAMLAKSTSEGPDLWKNTTIEENIVYNWSGEGTNRCFQSGAFTGEVENIVIRNNDFQFPRGDNMSTVMFHRDYSLSGGDRFSNHTYQGNRYFAANKTTVFSPGGDHAGWVAESGETGSSWGPVAYPDPERDIASYLTHVGGTGDTEQFMAQAIQLARANWNAAYTAAAVNDYIRAGFGR